MFGGHVMEHDGRCRPTSACEAINIKSGERLELHPMSCSRSYLSAAQYFNKVVITGGLNERNITLQSCEYYCLKEKAWKTFPAFEHGRYGHSVAVMNGTLYVVGGNSCKDIVLYDNKTYRWTTLRQLHVPRTFFTAVVC